MEQSMKNRLEQYRGVHPRLLMSREKAERLREEAGRAGRIRSLFEQMREFVDREVLTAPPPAYYYSEDESDGWQRKIGNQMILLACCHLITGREIYLRAMEEWAEKSCGYPYWGRGHHENVTLVAAHQLFGLAVIYDWCYDSLKPALRERIESRLYDRGGWMYRAACGDIPIFWEKQWIQNHMYICTCGLAAAAFAVFDRKEGTEPWMDRVLYNLTKSCGTMGGDGADHEGYLYWEYGVQHLLRLLEMTDSLLDVRFYDSPWIANTLYYGIYMTTPYREWTRTQSVADLGDCDRISDTAHILRRLASVYRNPHAQTMADMLEDKGLLNPVSLWQNLIWYDETVPAQPLTQLDTLRHFDDMELVSVRSGWDGDGETALFFKCGPYMGRKVYACNGTDPYEDWGGGHTHPDIGHFSLFSHGQWLLRDDGYSHKLTEHHNTLLIDGKGQAGEGWIWFLCEDAQQKGGLSRILSVERERGAVHITGDAAGAYPGELGLKKFIRHLVLSGDTLFVVNEIETETPRQLELRYFPEDQLWERREDGIIVFGDSMRMVYRPAGAGTQGTAELVSCYPGRGNISRGKAGDPEQRLVIRERYRGSRWFTAAAFRWCPAGENPEPPEIQEEDGAFLLSCGGGQIRINRTESGGQEEEK